MSTSGTSPTGPAYFITDTDADATVDDLWPATKPYRASNGNLAVPLVYQNTGTGHYYIQVHGSTDGGVTWAAKDTGNNFLGPTQTLFNALSGFTNSRSHNAGDAWRDGDTLYIAYWESVAGHLSIIP